MKAMTYARRAQAPSSAPQLKIGRADDAFEREADRAADEVMSGTGRIAPWSISRMNIGPPVQRKCSCGGGSEGECEECREKGKLQRKATGEAESAHAPAIVHDVLRSSGTPLDRAARSFFEPRFGHDFSKVRIHAGARAAASARAVSAQAYTVGNDVVFGTGQYSPDSDTGRKLLAHELAHVVQQRPASDLPQATGARSSALLERTAQLRRKAIAAAKPVPRLSRMAGGPRVQRSFLSGLLDVLLFIPRLFGLEYFPAEQLKDYLGELRKKKGPVGSLFSDNKARACVKREKELGPYDVDTKAWLIEDMLDGWTSPLDEGAIITLLRRSPADIQQIVKAVGRDHLWEKFSGENRRVIEAMTLTASDAGDALVTRLRDLSPDELQDYTKNTSDPAVLEAVRRATALSKITAPVPVGANVASNNQAQVTINRVALTFRPDGIDPSLGNHAMTYGQFSFAENTPVSESPGDAPHTYDGTAPLTITLEIWTNFPSEESKSGSSGYGAGSTLREHERAHGKGWIDFVTQNPPPQFAGRQNMTAAELNNAIQQYHAAIVDYQHRAGDFALRAGDCSVPGRLPTDEQLQGTGFTSAICSAQPAAATQTPAAATPTPATPAPAAASPGPTVQPKLEAGAVSDPLEREADRVADEVLGMTGGLRVADRRQAQANSVPLSADAVVRCSGEPLDTSTRAFFEPRFGFNFSNVRIHSGAAAAASARKMAARAYTVGESIVFNNGQYAPHSHEGRSLLAHELTHVVQQTGGRGAVTKAPRAVQRKVILKHAEMKDKDRHDFLTAHARDWGHSQHLASQLMEEMAAADENFDFEDDGELKTEIVKRISTVSHMKESQDGVGSVPGHLRKAFGYPFNPGAEVYGPRVNLAARDYWTPPVPDNYAARTDKAKIKLAMSLSRYNRHTVFGDQPLGPYFWKLTDKGKADPYTAIKLLFTPQAEARNRTLIHCDYLISLVNLLSFADSVGNVRFNQRIAAFGVNRIFLKADTFTDLHLVTWMRNSGAQQVAPAISGLGSTQSHVPKTEKDLVIGDHVKFFNHIAYDLLNAGVGNAWRLENAVFIANRGGQNVYLGHGSGELTGGQMKNKLASEFNTVVAKAMPSITKAQSRNKATAAAGHAELQAHFPNVRPAGTEYHIQGKDWLGCNKDVDMKVRTIRADEVIGLHNPCNPAELYPVERPIESAPGKAQP